MDLAGQRALVTGATSGIGRAVALKLAEAGAEVVVAGRDQARGAATVAAIDRAGGHASFIAADLNDLDSVQRLAEQAGDVDILVNNAGFGVAGPFVETDLAKELEMIQVNIVALTQLTKLLLPKMVARRRGRVLNVASTIGFCNPAGDPPSARPRWPGVGSARCALRAPLHLFARSAHCWALASSPNSSSQ